MKLNLKQLPLILSIIFLISSTVFILFRLFYSDGLDYLSYFYDDFFYYLKIAENFTQFGFPSFDGQTPTNGYHPLWFLILSGLSFLISDLFTRVVIITIIMLFSFYAIFNYTYKISIHISKSEYLSIIAAMFISFVSSILMYGGMEIIITIPVLLIIIHVFLKGIKNPLFYSLLISILFLSRLDTIFFIALFLLLLYNYDKKILFNYKFILGLLPVALYLLSNILYFEMLLPVSGAAKQLKTSLIPSTNIFKYLFRFDIEYLLISVIPFASAILNLLLIGKYKFNNQIEKQLVIVSTVFPLLLLIYYSVVSGWMFWDWYYYMFIPSLLFFILYCTKFNNFGKFLKYVIILLTAFVILFQIRYLKRNTPDDNILYQHAQKVAEFEDENKGTYAMGDRAGFVSYLIDSPVIQLEGLVMNKEYLNKLSSGKKLRYILKDYNVDYYISNNPEKYNSSWLVQEPYQHTKYTITSKDTFHFEPVKQIRVRYWNYSIFKLDHLYKNKKSLD